MRLGVSLAGFAVAAETTNVVDRAVEPGSQAERLGLDSVWFAQMASYDALAVASAVGRAVPRISVGTAVVPIYPRHPQILTSAAKTAQAATGGRFQLGIGLGAKDLLEPAYGLPYPPPITHLREYLGVLRPLLDGADTGYRGASQLAFYEKIPSQQRVLNWEGVDRAAELVVVGDEDTVAAGLRRYLAAGATEIALSHTDLVGEADRVRTWRLAGELARS